MNENSNIQFQTLEFKINTKYKNKLKEELKERTYLFLEYLIMFFIFIGLTIMVATD